MDKIILAYCRENADLAEFFDQKLSRIGLPFEHVTNQPGAMPGQFAAWVQSTTDPVILFVTDNFLKSQNCMASGLPMLRQMMRNNRILPVVADGKINRDGRWENTPTQFDRVIHAIQYMNFWQSSFLELRAKRDDVPKEESADFDDRMNVVREIAAEIGEFLNQLRDSEYLTWENFQANDFELFFKKFGIADWHPQYQQIAAFDLEQDVLQHFSTVESPKSVEVISNQPEIHAFENVEIVSNQPEISDFEIAEIISKQPEIPVFENAEMPSNFPEIPPKNHESTWIPVVEDAPAASHFDFQPSPNGLTSEQIFETPERPIFQEKPAPQPEDFAANGPSGEANLPHVFSEMDELIDEIVAEEKEFDHSDFGEIASKSPVENFQDWPTAKTLEKFQDENFQPEILAGANFEKIENPEIEQPPIPVYEPQAVGFQPIEPEIDHEIWQVEQSKKVEMVLADVDFWKEKGDTDRALRILDVAAKEYPGDPKITKSWLLTLAKTGRTTEANLFLEKNLIENGRPTAENFELRGDVANAANDFFEAKDNWEKAAFLEPNLPGIYWKLGQLTDDHFRGSKKSAAEYLKIAADQDPENPEIHYRLAAMLLEHLDKPKKAIRYLLNTVSLQKKHPSAWFDLAEAYRETGDPEKSELCYLHAIEINPAIKTPTNDRQFLLAFQHRETIAEPAPEMPKPVLTILTVLITGATSGIGRATAELFAKNGHRVILTGRREDRLEDIKTSFSETYKNENIALNFDVRDFSAVENALKSLPENWENIDLLINNAGLAKGLDFIHEGNLAHWETMIDTNLKGLLYVTRLVSPAMVTRRKGHIINVGSSAGKEVYAKGNVYCATKFAVDALSRAMRIDLHNHNIRVSQVSPGHVEETEFALNRFDGDAERAKIYNDFQPLLPADVADAIYFMATRPAHVNIQDLYLFGTQQANSTVIDRSGR